MRFVYRNLLLLRDVKIGNCIFKLYTSQLEVQRAWLLYNSPKDYLLSVHMEMEMQNCYLLFSRD